VTLTFGDFRFGIGLLASSIGGRHGAVFVAEKEVFSVKKIRLQLFDSSEIFHFLLHHDIMVLLISIKSGQLFYIFIIGSFYFFGPDFAIPVDYSSPG